MCSSIVVVFLGQHGHSAFQVQITSSLVTYRQQEQSIEEVWSLYVYVRGIYKIIYNYIYIGCTERVEY